MMWWIFTLSLWKSSLDGLASLHVLRLTLSDVPKIPLYCMEYNQPTTLAPMNEESSWAQWGKKPYRKKQFSIEPSEVNVCSVWILTTKRKSLKRVETCQKKHFNSWLFCCVNLLLELIFKRFYSLDIYPFDLFCIEPLIIHLYLNDVVLI